MMKPTERTGTEITRDYNELLSGILTLLEQGRHFIALNKRNPEHDLRVGWPALSGTGTEWQAASGL
jgi:hypothetical protein